MRGRRVLSAAVVAVAAGGLLVGPAYAAAPSARASVAALKAISPTAGPARGGNQLTISGTGLSGVTAVHFGSAVSKRITHLSATLLECSRPETRSRCGGRPAGLGSRHVSAHRARALLVHCRRGRSALGTHADHRPDTWRIDPGLLRHARVLRGDRQPVPRPQQARPVRRRWHRHLDRRARARNRRRGMCVGDLLHRRIRRGGNRVERAYLERRSPARAMALHRGDDVRTAVDVVRARRQSHVARAPLGWLAPRRAACCTRRPDSVVLPDADVLPCDRRQEMGAFQRNQLGCREVSATLRRTCPTDFRVPARRTAWPPPTTGARSGPPRPVGLTFR